MEYMINCCMMGRLGYTYLGGETERTRSLDVLLTRLLDQVSGDCRKIIIKREDGRELEKYAR